MPRRRRYRVASASPRSSWCSSRRSCDRWRNLNDREEKAELPDRVGEALVVHGLGDVDAAAEFVASLDLLGVVGRGQHHHGRAPEMLALLQLPQDLGSRHIRQVEIEQYQKRMSLVREAVVGLLEQVAQRICTISERHDLIVHAGSADVPFDQAGVAFVVLDHDDSDGYRHASWFRLLLLVQCRGSVIVKVEPLFSSEFTDMVPPSRRTSARTWASPMPWPGLSWAPARRNRSKMRL